MNRKSLTRWLALVAVGGLVGAGTTAYFSDSEVSAAQSLTAGTLDLVLGGAAQTAPINVTDVKPGDSGSIVLTLSNNGSLPGYLSLGAVETLDAENGCNEPEVVAENGCAADTNGELDTHLDVTLTSGADTWTGTLDAIDGMVRHLTGALGAGANRNLTIDWSIDGPGTGNVIQSDGVEFHIAVTLNQNPPVALASLNTEFLSSLAPAVITSGACNPAGSSTLQFTVSGNASGPYPGTFVETGTVTIGPQTEEFLPGQFRGPVTAFQSSFDIDGPAGHVAGTTTHGTPSPGGFWNFGACSGEAFPSAQIYAGPLLHTATVDGQPIDPGTGTAQFNAYSGTPAGSSSAQFRQWFYS